MASKRVVYNPKNGMSAVISEGATGGDEIVKMLADGQLVEMTLPNGISKEDVEPERVQVFPESKLMLMRPEKDWPEKQIGI